MPAFEVARTLVKSPPEVWAELEQVERLAALLDDEAIKITRVEPEKSIEWEGSDAHGRIDIEVSGWGTKVRLTTETDDAPETESVPVAEVVPEPTPEPEPEAEVVAELEPEPEPVADVAEEPVSDGLETKSFWQRFKSWFNSENVAAPVAAKADEVATADEPSAEISPEPIAAEPEREPVGSAETESVAEAELEPEPTAEPEPEPEPEPAPEPIDYEQRMVALLDHLGSAHKRPFVNA